MEYTKTKIYNIKQLVYVFKKVIGSIESIHAMGLVHGCITASSVMLEEREKVSCHFYSSYSSIIFVYSFRLFTLVTWRTRHLTKIAAMI